MLAFSLQFFRASHEYRFRRSHEGSECCEVAPQGQFSKGRTSLKVGGAWACHGRKSMCLRCNYYHSPHRRMCSLPLLLGSLVLLCSIGGKAAVVNPPTDPPEKPGPSGRYARGDDRGERDASGGFDDRVEANTPASKTARTLPEVHQPWLPPPLWQQGQQQPRAPGGRAVDNLVSSWRSVLRFLDPVQQETSKNLVGQSPHHPPAKVPQVQSNVEGTSSTVVPEGRRPVTSQQLSPNGKETPAKGLAAGKPSEAGITRSSQAESLKPQLSWLSPERQLTPEEEEEEALADAIIHGTSKKRVPRVHTAVDALVEAIEEEKLQRVAKTPRQLEHLRQRRKADMQAQKATVQMPEYFVRLAKEAAAFHKQQEQLQQREKKHPVGTVGHRLRTLALRQRQKDKLLSWRESQILQVPEDGPDLEKQIAEARKTDKELARTLLRDLSKEDLGWATGVEETQEEEVTGNSVDTAGKGKK